MNNMGMFVIGICIHIVFLFSIFDIYFKSPIVRNVVSYQPQHEAIADRLVLFVVDGLRAESFVNYTTMPYLRSIANSHGRWGISNTRVPTESRPGHVAIIAGFYEDPSAVAKGWKENPVDFDSVFNQTSYTWSWGTYDIVDIFIKESGIKHIFVDKFDPYNQTFNTDKNTTHLDSWVFEKVKQLFHKAKYDSNLNKRLHENKIVFFLHLLGTDTSGHMHKPKTQNFLTTVRFVDEGIKEIEKIITDFYNDDGKTTFLMTSDHGMTDWGSHGAGDDHETKTPYVLWGAGIQQVKERLTIDPETKDMFLEHRFDIGQADLTPLMSTILSIPVPVNSIGKLPVELLNMTLSNKAKAIYSNCRQLASQYDKKRLDVEADAIHLLYQPFEPLNKENYEKNVNIMENMLNKAEYEELIILSEEIMNLSLSGLIYYHNYYQHPLLILVTLSFLGWIASLLKVLLGQKMSTQVETFYVITDARNQLNKYFKIIFLLLLLISSYIVYAQNLPVQYYLYFFMPIFLWWYSLSPQDVWIQAFIQLKKNRNVSTVWVEILCYIIGSIAMGLSFTYRWMLSIPLLGMGLWPFFSSKRSRLTRPILITWSTGCILLSLFSFIPVVGKEVFIELVLVAGLIWLLTISFYTLKVLLPIYFDKKENKREIVLTGIQMILLMMSLQNIYVQSKRFEQGTPVSQLYQTLAWIIAVLSLMLPLANSRRLVCRLFAINTFLLIFYLLLSVSHEGLFMVTLNINVMCWMFIEFRLLHFENVNVTEYVFGNDTFEGVTQKESSISIERSISSQDFRRAFFFLLYIVLAFFGTGNIASLNSFEVRWVTCFITSFQPFLITGLILLKTLSPFLIVACSFRAVQHLTKAPTGYLNIIVLIYSNIMGIQLLYYVKNTGSWLEIGTSISQFVIVQVITVFIVLINQIAKVLTDVSYTSLADDVFKIKKKYV